MNVGCELRTNHLNFTLMVFANSIGLQASCELSLLQFEAVRGSLEKVMVLMLM